MRDMYRRNTDFEYVPISENITNSSVVTPDEESHSNGDGDLQGGSQDRGVGIPNTEISNLDEYRRKYSDKHSEGDTVFSNSSASLLNSHPHSMSESGEVTVGRPKTAFQLLKQKSMEEWEVDASLKQKQEKERVSEAGGDSDSDKDYFRDEEQAPTDTQHEDLRTPEHAKDKDNHVHFTVFDSVTSMSPPTPSDSPLTPSESTPSPDKKAAYGTFTYVPSSDEKSHNPSPRTEPSSASALECSKCHKQLPKANFSKTQLQKRKGKPRVSISCKVCNAAS